tara:strand:- start:2417 stop:2578 length:162 start_codon:yes stop_codon:yes gene_type:complete
MYEALEHWKQYKQKQDQAKLLFEECGFQRKEKAKQEVDKLLTQLATKNGITKI